MAPANAHLEWQEVRDFSAGLWTVSTALMPANAAQVMTDCYPAQGGGLRAWFKPSAISTTGIVSIANESVIGIFSRGGVGLRTGGTDTSDRYLATYNSTSGICRLYRMDLTAALSTWTLVKTFAAVAAGPNPMTFTVYQVTATGAYHVICALYQTSADDGLWSVNYSDGAVAKLTTPGSTVGPVAVHQSRLVAGKSDGNLAFSDPGTENFGTNLVTVEPSRQLGQITGLQSFSPGDLLCFKRGAPIFLVEGDLTDYTLRQMNDSKNPSTFQQPAYTPDGLAFVCGNDGLYITPEGQTIIPKAQSLLPGTWVQSGSAQTDVGLGDVSYTGHWLMAPRGYVMDYSSGAWFTSSFLNVGTALGDARHHCIDRAYQQILSATGGRNFSLYLFDTSEDSAHRAESYTWKSAPLRDPSGRQIQIREVQVAGQAFGAAATIQVTVNGTTRTSPVIAGRFNESFLFRESAEMLDVQVVPASNTGGVEAPTVEAVRMGSRPMHLIV